MADDELELDDDGDEQPVKVTIFIKPSELQLLMKEYNMGKKSPAIEQAVGFEILRIKGEKTNRAVLARVEDTLNHMNATLESLERKIGLDLLLSWMRATQPDPESQKLRIGFTGVQAKEITELERLLETVKNLPKS